ncbi:MAG: RidA family protein [Hyphomonadaceae bacterium]
MAVEIQNPPTLVKPTMYAQMAIVSAGRQLHIAGQVSVDAEGRIVGPGDIAAQAEQVYANVAAALAAAGVDFTRVFRMGTYIVAHTPEKSAAVRAVRRKYMGDGPYPAGVTLGIASLGHPDLLIEIEAAAFLD